MKQYLHIFRSIFVSMVGWSILQMLVTAIIGTEGEKGINPFTLLTAITNLPIFVVVCIITALIVFNIPRLPHKTLILYTAPTVAVLLGFTFLHKIIFGT